MAPSCESSVPTTTVCQTCGDKGDLELLIYCVQCYDSAVHYYCRDKISPDDDKIRWICEECSPKVPKVVPSRKSERRKLREDRNVEVRINWKKRLYKNACSTAKGPVSMEDECLKAAKVTKGCSLPIEEKNHLLSFGACGNEEHRKRRRRLIPEYGDSSEEQPEFFVCIVPTSAPTGHCGPSSMSYCQPSLIPDNFVHAQPIFDPSWRGCFSMTSGRNETHLRLMAHLSSKAGPRAHDATNVLPPVLDVEILPRCNMWPRSFQKSPPTDDDIALYFFPDSEREEKVFDGLLDDVNECNLALKALFGDTELLVFSSRELPQQHWRFRRKYYLWGVFMQKRHPLVVQTSGTECIGLTMPINQPQSKDIETFSETPITQTHQSLSTSNSRVSNRRYSPSRHKTKISSPDSVS